MTDIQFDAVKVERRRRSPFADLLLRLLREKPLGVVGGVIVIAMLLVGVFASYLAPYGLNESHLGDRLSPPSPQFALGTDNLGRDQLTRIIYGARISMIVGLAGAGMCIVIAAIIGLTSGYFGGSFDLVVQRIVDAWMCFPWLFLILTAMTLVGQGIVQVIMVLGIVSGIAQSRVIRSAVIAVKQNIYVEAGRVTGGRSWHILARHILPNVGAPIIIIFTLVMAQMILTEATVSFLGFGIPPPNASWGGMLSLDGRRYMLQAPWIALWPGLTLAITVYGINMLGDALRDLLDPRLKGGVGRYGASVRRKR